MPDDPVLTPADTNPRRLRLLSKVDPDAVRWHRVPLAGGASVAVSLPVKFEGVWLPVTAAEQGELCRAHGWLPLTRAVADRAVSDAHAAGRFVPFRGQYPHLADFERFARWLDTTAYGGSPQPWAAGAHKLWLLSRHPNVGAVNYGFFGPGAKPDGHPNLLAPLSVTQELGGRHNRRHWDYSQLLQVMRDLRSGERKLDLRAELLAGSACVWDETERLREADLPGS